MPRIKLFPHPEYPFQTDITVRTTDLNYGGHLGNDKLLSLIQEARVAFLANHGQTELNCDGVSLIMGDAAIQFKGEAYAGNVLRVEVAAGEPIKKGFRLFHRVTRIGDGALIALVETGMACYDYKEQRLRSLPPALIKICHPEG